MLALRWRPSARAELRDIIEYIGQVNPAAASKLRDRIFECVQPARSFPDMFRIGRIAGTREIVAHPNYIVVYRVLPDHIDVVAVLHSRQQYPPDDEP